MLHCSTTQPRQLNAHLFWPTCTVSNQLIFSVVFHSCMNNSVIGYLRTDHFLLRYDECAERSPFRHKRNCQQVLPKQNSAILYLYRQLFTLAILIIQSAQFSKKSHNLRETNKTNMPHVVSPLMQAYLSQDAIVPAICIYICDN